MPASLIKPPESEPTTLAEIVSIYRLPGPTTDEEIKRLIATARAHIEASTRRVMITQIWRAYYDRWPAKRKMTLPIMPVKAIEEVRVFNTNGEAQSVHRGITLDSSRAPATVYLQACLPAPTAYANGIEIDMVCGYGEIEDVPIPLRTAVQQLVIEWLEQKEKTGKLALTLPSSKIEGLISPYRVIWP